MKTCNTLLDILIAMLLLIPCFVNAETINVPDDIETIQDAIQAAEDGDVVLVEPGEYDENIDFLGKAITVTSHIHLNDNPDFIESTIIDGGRRQCVVSFANGEDNGSVLRGFTIRNGRQDNGGGIICEVETSPILVDLVVTENEAVEYGGGIFLTGRATPLISRVLILSNTAEFGGGLGLRNISGGELEDVIIMNNRANDSGGGIFAEAGCCALLDVLICGNSARSEAGGAYVNVFPNTFRNVTITDNVAEEGTGGGLHLYHFRNFLLQNCIIYNNSGRQLRLSSSSVIVIYSDIEGGEDEVLEEENANLIWSGGNISANPRFVNPDESDYNLTSNSPCIDSGDPQSEGDPYGTRADMGALYYDHLRFPRELVVSLTEQWNLMSINIVPTEDFYLEDEDRGPDIILMTEQLRIDEDNHQIRLMKDEEGRFYNPERGFNNIPFWDLSKGYFINVDEDVDASWEGIAIPYNSNIQLEENWNYLGFFPSFELDASAPDFYVLSQIIDNVMIAKDGQGNFMLPGFEFSNMPPWCETKGYQVKLDENVILNYPLVQIENGAMMSDVRYPHPAEEQQFVTSSENMSVLVTAVQGFEPAGGDKITAFNSDEHIVGTGVINADGQCGIAVWGDDPTTDVTDGLREGETFQLKLWDAKHGLEYALINSMVLEGEGLVYEPDGLSVIEMAIETTIPKEFFLSEAYPNPFNSTVRLSYGLPDAAHVSIGVYDVAGRLVETLINQSQQSGHHTVLWNSTSRGGSATSGIYFVRMSAGEFNSVRKIILMK